MSTSWTDNPVVADSTKIRAIHVNELRTAINSEISRRGGIIRTFTDGPNVTASVTKVREGHIRELRAAADYAKAVDCATDTSPIATWTDNPLVTGTTKIRAVHINELRSYLNSIEGACLCNCDGHCGCNGLCCNCDHCGSHCSPH